MKEMRKIFVLTVLFLFSLSAFPFTLDEILKKNMEAVGGREKLSAISNLSIKVGELTFYARRDGKVKIVKGKGAVCVEVIVLEGDKIRKNSIKGIEEVKGVERVLNIFQGRLFSGVFTTSGFGEGLKYNGMKSFGMKRFHELTSRVNDVDINLYIDRDDFLIKRAVLSFYDLEKEKQEINYDFGPYLEKDGIKFPSSWFVSKVGARGNLYEIEEVKFNLELPEKFFEDFSLNIGTVRVSEGELKGNVIDFYERQGRLFVVSNWTSECFEKAGIGNGDTVVVMISGKSFELSFYRNIDEARRAGTLQRGNILSKTQETEFYTLFISEFSDLRENLQILQTIELKKK